MSTHDESKCVSCIAGNAEAEVMHLESKLAAAEKLATQHLETARHHIARAERAEKGLEATRRVLDMWRKKYEGLVQSWDLLNKKTLEMKHEREAAEARSRNLEDELRDVLFHHGCDDGPGECNYCKCATAALRAKGGE